MFISNIPLLTHKFGKRAGDMKMSSLARYFGLGDQTHRSLDDARMTLEVLKSCATVSLLMNLYERDGHNEPSDTSNSSRKKNMKRLGGGGLSLQTFANLKSKNSHYNPAFIKFYKNAKYVSKFRKSMKQHDKEVKLQSFREEDETGDSSRVVGDDDKRKGKSHKRIGVDEVYKQTREVMEKARMEREAALQAKREAKEEAESLRRVAKGKMMRKTRHGQPVMKYRIEHLLESIKKSAENDVIFKFS
ncbi:hypothetical protein HID58_053014 [Brassica napus]|uniref:Exonuclease domain-containing protein n=1 Tax=Brassica napus TaxID=3708 RepID=A0ABQ8ADI5_BRANA|nr:hypothetical protein HID58_053014 [Brassica napus]